MPRVPGVGPGYAAPSVTPAHDATGAQLASFGGALLDAGSTVWRAEAQWQHDLDAARIKEKSNAAAELVHQTLFDPTSGYTRVLGKAALDQRTKVAEDLQAKLRALGDGLDNDEQKTRYQEAAGIHFQDAMARIDDHAGRQVVAYNVGQTQAAIELAKRSWTDAETPAARTESRAVLLSRIAELGDLTGASPEQVTEARLKNLSEMHVATLETLQDRPGEAASYLRQFSTEIDPVARARAERVIGKASIAQESQTQAWQLIDNVKDKGTPGEQFAKALSDLDRMGRAGDVSAEVLDATTARLSQHFARQDSLATDQRNELLNTAVQYLVDNPTATSLVDAPELADAVQTAGIGDKVNAFLNSDRRVVTDNRAMMDVTLAHQQGAFRGMPQNKFLEQFAHKLAPSDLQRAIAMWADNNGTAKGEQMQIVREQQVVESYADALGLGATEAAKDPALAKRRIDWLLAVQREIDAAGLPKTDIEGLGNVIERMNLDTATKDAGWFHFNKQVPVSTLQPGDSAWVTVASGDTIDWAAIPSAKYTGTGEFGVQELLRAEFAGQKPKPGYLPVPYSLEAATQRWDDLGRPKTAAEYAAAVARKPAIAAVPVETVEYQQATHEVQLIVDALLGRGGSQATQAGALFGASVASLKEAQRIVAAYNARR